LHPTYANSIVNHLAILFNRWQCLKDFANKSVKVKLDNNLKRHRPLLIKLQSNAQNPPFVDPFSLPLIFQNFMKRL